MSTLTVLYYILQCGLSQKFTTIWYDDMTDKNHWDVTGDVTIVDGAFWANYYWASCYDIYECCDQGECAALRLQNSVGSEISILTNITQYTLIRLQFDIGGSYLYQSDECQVYYAYDSIDNKALIYRYTFDLPLAIDWQNEVTLDLPASPQSTQLWIFFEAADLSPENIGGATCYFDDVYLKGANPTDSPTKYSSTSPTKYPSTSPTKYPSTSPTKYPSSSPTKYPSDSPTKYPSTLPTKDPSQEPNAQQTVATTSPTHRPTLNTMIEETLTANSYTIVETDDVDEGTEENETPQKQPLWFQLREVQYTIGGCVVIITILCVCIVVICLRHRKQQERIKNINIENVQQNIQQNAPPMGRVNDDMAARIALGSLRESGEKDNDGGDTLPEAIALSLEEGQVKKQRMSIINQRESEVITAEGDAPDEEGNRDEIHTNTKGNCSKEEELVVAEGEFIVKGDDEEM